MDNMEKLSDALVGVLNAPTRPPALRPLARLKYPPRGLFLIPNPDGPLTATMAKWGFQYKCRSPRPKSPPTIDPAAMMEAFNSALPDGLSVIAVEDRGRQVAIQLKEENLC